MLLLTADFAQKYTELFNIIFTYATPFFKLAFMIFGAVYGISAFGLSQDIGTSQKEAAQYMQQYFFV